MTIEINSHFADEAQNREKIIYIMVMTMMMQNWLFNFYLTFKFAPTKQQKPTLLNGLLSIKYIYRILFTSRLFLQLFQLTCFNVEARKN